MVNCFAPDCSHHSESHTCKFFRFPASDGEKKKWISLIRHVPNKGFRAFAVRANINLA